MNFRKAIILFVVIIFGTHLLKAQDNLYARFTTKESKNKIYRNLINYTVNHNLSLTLNDTTETNWEDAFGALELLLYKNQFVNKKIDEAIENIDKRSSHFQRALLELAYANYPSSYLSIINNLLQNTADAKIFAMCAEYILQPASDSSTVKNIEENINRKFINPPVDPVIIMLENHIQQIKIPDSPFIQHTFFIDILSNAFLPGQIIMYSFQRRDRNYPGLVVIRNGAGKFIRDSSENIFNIPQLARSITNLPGYLQNGNTPQGIFKMYGFGVSSSIFIGPTPNIQMAMPGEMSLQKFFNDSTIKDTLWSKEVYGKLLPKNLKGYFPLYASYYAGLAGRTEIISHGTTIDPEYYKNQPYYPLTPTQGCLCAKEIWDGKILESDQKKLVNALLKAGGAQGYCIVVELDDKKAPITIDEILPQLLKAESLK